MDTLTLIFFAVNLIYIVTNVYGYLLKRFFVPDIYKKDAAELFPARRLPRDSPRAAPSRRSSNVSRALRRRNICARKNNLLIISGFILRQLTQIKAILTQNKAFLTQNKGRVGLFLEFCFRKQSKKS